MYKRVAIPFALCLLCFVLRAGACLVLPALLSCAALTKWRSPCACTPSLGPAARSTTKSCFGRL
jgi:hypothetical protein